jgi:DNA polymerase-3 subunit alpha
MAFATLSDYNGEIEVTFFSGAWERCQDKIEADKVAMLKGKIEYQKDKDRRSFIADDWVSVNEADETAKEEEARFRKWDKYRNIRIYARELDLRILDLAAAAKAEAGTYTIVGLIKSLRTHTDKKGNEMAFASLQDDRGEIDLVFFSRTWEKCKAVVDVDEILALKGTIDPAKDRNPEKPGFMVSSIQDINKLIRMSAKAEETAKKEAEKAPGAAEVAAAEAAAGKREVHIRLNQETAEREENLYPLRDYLFGHSGSCSVFIHVPASAGETVIRTATQIRTSPEPAALEAITLCAGVADVWRE